MILAHTTESAIGHADEYSFLGPEAAHDKYLIRHAAAGLLGQQAMTGEVYDALVRDLAEPTLTDTAAIQGLHTALYQFTEGYQADCTAANREYDPLTDGDPLVLGRDGLQRVVGEDGQIEILTDHVAATMGQDRPIADAMGATHVAYQYDIDCSNPDTIAYRTATDHMSLGVVDADGAYQGIATWVYEAECTWPVADTDAVARMRGAVTVAPQIVAPPHFYAQ